jgi:hypothetical protein
VTGLTGGPRPSVRGREEGERGAGFWAGSETGRRPAAEINRKKEGGEMGRVGRMGREEFFFFFFFSFFKSLFLNQFQTFLNSNLLHVFKFKF